VVRGWIGIRPQTLKAEEARQFGFPEGSVVVTAVYRGGPADAEGIRPGDVITEIEGQSLTGAEDLLSRIAALKPGEAARVTLRRGPPFEGPPRELQVRVGVIERPARAAASS
jgi:serine protease DegQ